MHKIYRCSIDTHQRILQYIHDRMIEDKKLPAIKETCNQLSITRGTFYLHFSSIEEAKQEVDQRCWNKFLELADVYREDSLQKKVLPFSFLFFEWLKQDLAYYQSFLLTENNIFTQNLLQFLKERSNAEDDMHTVFAVYGIFGFLQQWLKQVPKKGSYEAAKQLDELLKNLKIRSIV